MGAVSSRPEGGCTGALRCQHHVVVYPLTPLNQQVGQCGVQRDVVIVGEQHLLRHQPHLDDKQSVGATSAEDERVLLQDSSLLEAEWHYGRCAPDPSLWVSPMHPHTLEAASGNMGCLQPPIWDVVLTGQNTTNSVIT